MQGGAARAGLRLAERWLCGGRLGLRRGPARPLAPVLWVACTGLMLVYLSVFWMAVLERVRRPDELQYGEAVVLGQVQRLEQGGPLYPPLTELPLTITAYTPLYYILVGWVQPHLGGVGYTLGREVSLAATVMAAALLAGCVVAAGGRWTGGLLASGLFVTQNLTVLLWAPTYRVDALALCLTLVGVLLLALGAGTWCALPLALAVLTKQTYLAAPAAVCLALWPCRRALLPFVGVFGGVAVPGLLLAQLLTGGWFFWHIVVANANPLDVEYFGAMVGQFAPLNALPVCLAASLYALPSRPGERVWRWYLPLTGLATLVSIGKLGASSNYWLELTAVTAVCVGLVVDRLATVRGPTPFGPAGVAAAVLAALLMSLPAYQATALGAIRSRLTGLTGPARTQLLAASRLAQEPGDVLTDDPSLSLLAGKPIQFEFVIFTVLAAQGVWDEHPILEAIAAQRFSVVVLTGPIDAPPRRLIEARWTESVAHAIQAAYEFEREQDGYWYYRPRRVATTRPAITGRLGGPARGRVSMGDVPKPHTTR